MSAVETSQEAPPRPPKLSQLVEELVRAAEQGDRARFDVIFDACVTRVYAVASGVARDRSGAEQVTASVLLRIAQRGSRRAEL